MEEARNVLKQANRSKSVDLTVARDESEETVSYDMHAAPGFLSFPHFKANTSSVALLRMTRKCINGITSQKKIGCRARRARHPQMARNGEKFIPVSSALHNCITLQLS